MRMRLRNVTIGAGLVGVGAAVAAIHALRAKRPAFGVVMAEDGRKFPVCGIFLKDGVMKFQFEVTGPAEAGQYKMDLIGMDGEHVTQLGSLKMPNVIPDKTLHIVGVLAMKPAPLGPWLS